MQPELYRLGVVRRDHSLLTTYGKHIACINKRLGELVPRDPYVLNAFS